MPKSLSSSSGIGNWDQPRHTTCRGRPIWENPTYSAFWNAFGVTRLRFQRLARRWVREDGTIGAQEEPTRQHEWSIRGDQPRDGSRGPGQDILLIGTAQAAKSWLHHLTHEPPQHEYTRGWTKPTDSLNSNLRADPAFARWHTRALRQYPQNGDRHCRYSSIACNQL